MPAKKTRVREATTHLVHLAGAVSLQDRDRVGDLFAEWAISSPRARRQFDVPHHAVAGMRPPARLRDRLAAAGPADPCQDQLVRNNRGPADRYLDQLVRNNRGPADRCLVNGGVREWASQVPDLHFKICNLGPKSTFSCPKPPYNLLETAK